ncbi:ATP-binding protein [Candidatus Woesearchaeota archaeon]|nr:ATP-binding protein [Candidatus Woesearchaeota archaeon]
MKPRKIFNKLMEQRNSKKVSLVLGARQVGKTTVLKALYNLLSGKNRALFLDLDIFTNFEKVSTFENLVNTLKLVGYEENQNGFFYLFLDEFQRYNDLSVIMKNVYDSFDNIKIYASGSSSMRIKDQIQETLAGRKIINILHPLDFEEFLWFKESKTDVKKTKKLSGEGLHKPTSALLELLKEFMVFGGYPEVVLQKKGKDKIEALKSIFDLYVKKDLVEYLKIEKILQVKKLIEFLAINNGKKIKYDEISALCSLSYKEVKGYIEILQETYLVYVLRPFFTNKNKELVKVPKVYFVDNGVRDFFINNFNPVGLRGDEGFLFEGYVLSELLKSGKESVKFWQDKNGHEADFVLDDAIMEVKFKTSLKHGDFTGLKAFATQYKGLRKQYLINLAIQKRKDKTRLKLPYALDFAR